MFEQEHEIHRRLCHVAAVEKKKDIEKGREISLSLHPLDEVILRALYR